MFLRNTILGVILVGTAPLAMGANPADQSATQATYQVSMTKFDQSITVDGVMDEEVWQSANHIPFLNNHWPIDSGRADADTKIWLGFDDEYMYVAARMHDQGTRIVQSLNRDEPNFWSSDGFSVLVDPVNQRTNGYLFGVNAGGAQLEATISTGGNERMDRNWDNKWYSAVTQQEDYWLVEMAIPFKTLRYSPDATDWGINFIRNDMANNTFQTWTTFPNNFPGVDLGFTGLLQWNQAPPGTQSRVALLPYVATNVSRDYENGEPWSPGASIGGDAKIAVTSSLNVDLTLNPDFSNVNVDLQQTNLTRFSLWFPEQRPFFLENGDLFANFGNWAVKPFFSRKVGLHDGKAVPILYGARLSGNATENTRVGLMNIQSRATDEVNAQNVTVAAMQQRIWSRSTLSAIVTNQHTLPGETGNADFNRNLGAEFQYVSPNGQWEGQAKYHLALDPETPQQDRSFRHLEVNYGSRNYFIGLHHHHVGTNYVSELGFAPRLYNYDEPNDTTVRLGYDQFNIWGGYNNYPEKGPILMHGIRSWSVGVFNPDRSMNELINNLAYFTQFRSQESLRVHGQRRQINLPYATSFVSDAEPIPQGSYTFFRWSVSGNTDPRKALSLEAQTQFGGFYNGKLYSAGGTLNYRAQPWGNFGINYQANRIVLPGHYGQTTLHLLGPQVNISFSNSMFWTTVLQYNTQSGTMGINSRFQWRYLPMSDLFVVVSDNYLKEDFTPTQRALVIKLTYWLN